MVVVLKPGSKASPPGATRFPGQIRAPTKAALWVLGLLSLPSLAAPPPPSVEALLSSLTLEQKIGQLMIVGFGGTKVDASIAALVRGHQVGGVCMFKRNIVNQEQIARLNDEVRSLLADKIPPFIAVDQEGGNVVRIQDAPVVLPGNMALGATRSAKLAYEAGKAQAQALKLLGFNMNLAPVLDINSNPKNPVIGIRSFGDDPALVSEFGSEFVRGQQDADLVTIAKHFPGHGTADADSHRSLPVLHEDEAELMAQLRPFEKAIAVGLDGLMTAHVAVPAFTGNDLPATLSSAILTRLLRDRLHFQGLLVTDELEMDAIAHRFGVGRAAVLALRAGADMVLIPWRAEKKAEVYRALLRAARSGRLPASRLDQAVRRILSVKVRRGLFDPPAPLAERLEGLGKNRSDVDKRIAQGSITLLKGDPLKFPLSANKRIGVITAEPALGEAIHARAAKGRILVVPAFPPAEAKDELKQKTSELAAESDLIIVGVINASQLELASVAAATGKPIVVVTMGLPYLAELVPEASAVLATYSYQPASTEAVAAALFGAQGTPGKLPVALRHFPFGYGLNLVGPKVAVHRP